jgi:hypothetical protein
MMSHGTQRWDVGSRSRSTEPLTVAPGRNCLIIQGNVRSDRPTWDSTSNHWINDLRGASVTDTTLTVALATGRCGVGAAVFLRPNLLTRGMGADRETAERTAWVARMFAVRDLAVGVGVLWAVRQGSGLLDALGSGKGLLGRGISRELRAMLLLGVLCDVGDAVAVTSALRGRSVSALPAAATIATAVGAAATGAVLAAR